MKILIIEDELTLSNILRDKFEEEGWKADTVFDGQEALDKLARDKYDILLLDILMPKTDGFEVLKKIREEASAKDLPVIIMSNLGDEESVKKGMDLGANDYFVKNQQTLGTIMAKVRELALK